MNNQLIAATLLRISLGIMFIAHGLLKVFVFTMAGSSGFFESVGFPGWLVYPTVGFEVVGGLLLVLGIWVKPLALAGIPILLGALWVHFANGWVFSAPNGGWEYPAFLIVVSLAVALLGKGRFALGGSHQNNA